MSWPRLSRQSNRQCRFRLCFRLYKCTRREREREAALPFKLMLLLLLAAGRICFGCSFFFLHIYTHLDVYERESLYEFRALHVGFIVLFSEREREKDWEIEIRMCMTKEEYSLGNVNGYRALLEYSSWLYLSNLIFHEPEPKREKEIFLNSWEISIRANRILLYTPISNRMWCIRSPLEKDEAAIASFYTLISRKA